MIFKSLFAGFGCDITRIWFFADELFFDDDVIFGFKRFGMARKISIGNAEQFFEGIEISGIIDHQNRHDAQSDPVIKCLVYILDDVLQEYWVLSIEYWVLSIEYWVLSIEYWVLRMTNMPRPNYKFLIINH